jgi:ribosomal protein S18 acetylase RimI-like enzyme
MKAFQIRPLNKEDKGWVVSLLTEHRGSARSVSRGRLYQADELPGFIAAQKDKPIGLITYNIDAKECEITTINSLVERQGVGSALVDAVKGVAITAKCKRLWLITTNDNTAALKFWQKRGFQLAAIYPGAVIKSRLVKPEIPLTGNDGIPIRDEIELETVL